MEREWIVRFARDGKAGREAPIEKQIQWGNKALYIPACYVCEEGLILDICVEADRGAVRQFLEKWEPRIEKGLSRQEQRLLRREQPMNIDFRCHILINGEQAKNWHSSKSFWLPEGLRPKSEPYEDRAGDYLEHYGLDAEKPWIFQRFFYDWPNGPQEDLSLEGRLSAEYQEFAAAPFAMPQVGEKTEIQNPHTGQLHILTVEAIRQEAVTIPEHFAEYEMPQEATVMIYRLEPDLSMVEFQLKDTQEQDQARRKDGSPYHAGSVGMILRLPKDGSHAAASSMRFQAPDTVLWEPIFKAKILEDITVKIL